MWERDVKDCAWQSCVCVCVWQSRIWERRTHLQRGCYKCHACHAKRKVDVAKCHGCHAKRRWMSPSATPATQSAGACHQVLRLPRKDPRWAFNLGCSTRFSSQKPSLKTWRAKVWAKEVKRWKADLTPISENEKSRYKRLNPVSLGMLKIKK